jgi:sugar lactone lactonase YvrE
MSHRIRLACSLAVCLMLPAVAGAQTIHTVAGGGPDLPAASAALAAPIGLARDASGNVFILNAYGALKLDPSGHVSRITGMSGQFTGLDAVSYFGDGGPAVNAGFTSFGGWPFGMATDAAGNLYLPNQAFTTTNTGSVIRAINLQNSPQTLLGVTIPAGNIAAVVGIGTRGDGGDGGAATSASLDTAFGASVAFDPSGNLYILESDGSIHKVDTSGVISLVANLGVAGNLITDAAGNLYIAKLHQNVIEVLNMQPVSITVLGITIPPAGLAVVAGNGGGGYSGDGGPATSAELTSPAKDGLALDTAGNLYIADAGNNCIRRVDQATGIITTVAGTGLAGFSGDGSSPASAQLSNPEDVMLDGNGNLYIADTGNNRIRAINLGLNSVSMSGTQVAPGTIATVAGNGFYDYAGDGFSATSATLFLPHSIAVDAPGNLYILDSASNVIRAVNTQTTAATLLGVTIQPGNMATVAGNGTAGSSGDGGPAIHAQLHTFVAANTIGGIALDSAGNLYLADVANNSVRKVDNTGVITTVAGSSAGFSGDGGPASAAQLYYPVAVATDAAGNLYIRDSGNARIRMVNMSATAFSGFGLGSPIQPGNIDTVADIGAFNDFRDGGLTVDAAGNLYLATGSSGTIKVDVATGNISVFDNLNPLGNQDSDWASVDAAGNVYLTAGSSSDVRVVNTQATSVTLFGVSIPAGMSGVVAGSGVRGYNGDGIPATSAQLNGPFSGIVDAWGNLYIADAYNGRIRRVDGPVVTPVIDWSTPADITYGTALSATQLNATTVPAIAGTFAYLPPSGTVLNQGVHTLSVTFTPAHPLNYATVSSTVNLNVQPFPPTVTVTGGTFPYDGHPHAATATATGVAAATVSGTFSFTYDGSPTPPTAAGIYPVVARFTSSDPNYSNASGNGLITITASGPVAKISPPSIDFGKVYLKSVTTRTVTITNTGNAAMTISNPLLAIAKGGNSSAFVVVNLCPKTLGPGHSCVMTVSFVGCASYTQQNATLSIKDNAPGNPQTVALTGLVVNPQASLSATSLSFGSQKLHTTATKPVTLKNTGATTLTITGMALTGPNGSEFGWSSTCGGSLTAGHSCTISVSFTPAVKSSRSATLRITDDAQNSPQSVALSGTGK